jgi:cytochrome c556
MSSSLFSSSGKHHRLVIIASALIVGSSLSLSIRAQTPPPAPSPSKQAIDVRKAAFTLIGNNFKPIGDVLQGRTPFDAAEVQKRASRVAFLSQLLTDTFPDASNVGLPDTKAKAEIWSDRAAFDKRLKDFQDHAAVLAQLAVKESSASDAFKAAATAVAQDCKGCHDSFKAK